MHRVTDTESLLQERNEKVNGKENNMVPGSM